MINCDEIISFIDIVSANDKYCSNKYVNKFDYKKKMLLYFAQSFTSDRITIDKDQNKKVLMH